MKFETLQMQNHMDYEFLFCHLHCNINMLQVPLFLALSALSLIFITCLSLYMLYRVSHVVNLFFMCYGYSEL